VNNLECVLFLFLGSFYLNRFAADQQREGESFVSRKRNLYITIVAAIIAGLIAYGVYILQLRNVEFQETVSVVAPKQFIAAGEQLRPDMLSYKTIARAALEKNMLQNMDDAIGMETVVPLGNAEPLLDWKIDQYRLLPDREQSTFQIPQEYVRSVSNGIRAGDRVVIYTSTPFDESRRLFSEPVVVASVKSASNQEIEDADNSNLLSMASGDKEKMYASRRDANGTIDFINLNLTEDEWLELDNLCKTGETLLVIAYSSESLDISGLADNSVSLDTTESLDMTEGAQE
jgi:hypothetical protein